MLKILNIFSQPPTLRINGSDKPISIFGSIIGFFSISILFGAICFILNSYFSRLSFNISSYIDNSARPDINLDEFKLGILLTDIMGTSFPEHERLFTISAMMWNIYLPKFGENKTQKIDIVPIPTIKCNQYKNGTLLKGTYDDLHKNYQNEIVLRFWIDES